MGRTNNAWMVRPFPHHINRIVDFLKNDIVALGWPGIGNLRGQDLAGIKRLVRRVYRPANARSLGQNAGELDTLVNRVADGDYVVVPSPEDDSVYIGRIRGGYKYDRTRDNDRDGYPHQRSVHWLLGKERVSRLELPTEVTTSLRAQQAICSVDAAGLGDVIATLCEVTTTESNGRGDPGFVPGDALLDMTLAAVEGGKRMLLKAHFARERRLRFAKIRQARSTGDGRLRCEVPGCGFDFEEVYGPIGRDFAHVHHLKPLAWLKRSCRITLDDLAVVCANCHAMIHHGGECRRLDGLIRARGSFRRVRT